MRTSELSEPRSHDALRARDYSVLIVGGGPAGLATAIELARQGVATVVVERSAYDDLRVGEHVGPAGMLQLRAFDPGLRIPADVHSPSAGVIAYWGSETANHMDYFFHPGQHGLNLCRPRFDADLARAAELSGVAILRSASLYSVGRRDMLWRVDVRVEGRTDKITVPVIVDATGRAATFSRRQGARLCAHDRQVAVVAFQSGPSEGCLSTRSILEAAETGWWYYAPINTTRSMCMFVTDDDLLPRGTKRDLYAWWRDQLDRTLHVARQLRMVAPSRDFVTRSARSQCLDVQFGSGWLAVGDAAMAFDPLASQGIAKALDHGGQAAAIISAHLAGDGSSLERFALNRKREYAEYQSTRAQYYRLETRWPRSIFWTRRHGASRSAARSSAFFRSG